MTSSDRLARKAHNTATSLHALKLDVTEALRLANKSLDADHTSVAEAVAALLTRERDERARRPGLSADDADIVRAEERKRVADYLRRLDDYGFPAIADQIEKDDF